MSEKMLNRIPVNIWDDYDGDKPDTYAYVEEYDFLTEGQKESIVELLLTHLKTMELPGVKMKVKGTDLEFRNFPHIVRENVVEQLKNHKLQWKGIPIEVYSES